MNTLFAKILAWFGLTLVVIFIGLSVITALQIREAPQRGNFPMFHLELALEVRKHQGDDGLRRYLQRFGDAIRNDVAIVDGDGRDLLTGEVRVLPPPRGEMGARPWLPFLLRAGPPPMRVVSKGPYRMVMSSRDEPQYTWWLSPQNFWIVGAAILLCFGLAAYVSRPLRLMQRAVEQYGTGNLELRLNSKRRDEFGRLARAFDQMADHIQTLLSAERRLLADISHELRSPLARLSVATELLDEPDERDAARLQIRRETERLNQLIGGLLEVTRAEGDPSHVRREPMNLQPLMQEIVNDCSFEARERSVEIAYKPEDELLVRGDAELLRRAAENVIRNALRFAPQGSAVQVDCLRQDDAVLIQVRDFGPGVPIEALARIFDPFFRVEDDRNRRQGGSGLGLSIARRAVELHGGSIVARNANPGLLVEIHLPIAADATIQ
ncbi:MAG: ATP-binding protein [Bryobacterales bacterium]|jgi:two-component system sensor histidine kinase CpxA|nr:ATP-binding protein [Bryobacterales bacterium]